MLDTPALPNSTAATLSTAQLAPVISQAIADWEAAGITASQVNSLEHVQFDIVYLPGSLLGETMSPSLVYLNANAAGYGWFVDASAGSSADFSLTNSAGNALAGSGSPAYGHVDLLTVVEHEFGHVLGLPDQTSQSGDLMYLTLGLGVRRAADAADVQAIGTTAGTGLNYQVLDVGSFAPAASVSTAAGGNAQAGFDRFFAAEFALDSDTSPDHHGSPTDLAGQLAAGRASGVENGDTSLDAFFAGQSAASSKRMAKFVKLPALSLAAGMDDIFSSDGTF
jgi:hypothetical protein